MRYLLDTSVWFRGVSEPESLPENIRKLLAGSQTEFGLSVISLWEIANKHQIGKLTLNLELGAWLKEAIAANVTLLSLTPEIIVDAMALPGFPVRDPADELIVATARVHNLTLLTSDTKLKKYNHAKIQHFTPITP